MYTVYATICHEVLHAVTHTYFAHIDMNYHKLTNYFGTTYYLWPSLARA